jgi:cytochrome P450
MTALVERDYFTDHSILLDPYEYFDAVREKGPVYRLPGSDVVVVTGFEETLEVLKNTDDFSSSIAIQGAGTPLPFAPHGDDLAAEILTNRPHFFGGDLLVALDDMPHRFSRSILSQLFTPSRLKASKGFMTSYAEELVRGAVAKGGCELIGEIATPFVTIVIADLLGVPEADRQIFMDAIAAGPPPGSLNAEDAPERAHPLEVMGRYFAIYVQDRRDNPRDDVLTHLAQAKYPDGSTPDLMEIVRLATFLFGAGQDTSAKLLGNSIRYIIDHPGLQQKLRADASLIPQLLEEVLRLEGSSKVTSRLARRATRIGNMDIPIGTRVLVALAASNRDPAKWNAPNELQLGRPAIKEHLAFGRGAHVCMGAPLARVEIRIILEKFLELTADIDMSKAVHGPRGARLLEYEPSFIVRGLERLHLVLTPA